MAETDVLQDLGLSEIEAKIYLSLLGMGEVLAGEIIKKTGLHKSTVYLALGRLQAKGIVSIIKKEDMQYFSANSPERLMELLEVKKGELSNILGSLTSRYKQRPSKLDVRILVGKPGIKTMINDAIKAGKAVCIFGGKLQFTDYINYAYPTYLSKVKEKNIEFNAILVDLQSVRLKVEQAAINANVRYVPEKYSSSVVWAVFSDITAIILWNEETIIYIKNEECAQGFIKYFNLLWRVARP